MQEPRIESLLSARLFQEPQTDGDRIYFVSNLSGQISLYAMNYGGSVPEPLIPPDIALQNPHLMPMLFHVLPQMKQILIMIDSDGDENYQPMLVPMTGGYPVPAFGDQLADYRCHCAHVDIDHNVAYFFAEARDRAWNVSFRGRLDTGELEEIYASEWGGWISDADEMTRRVALVEGYTAGDNVLYLLEPGQEPRLLYGIPLADRQEGETVPPNAVGEAQFTESGAGLLLLSAVFEDAYGPCYLRLDMPHELMEVKVMGLVHNGQGEMETLTRLGDDRFLLQSNIDGATWLYETEFDESQLTLTAVNVICGQPPLSGGVMEHPYYDKAADRYAMAHSTATSPTQIYTVEGDDRTTVVRHTNERVLGLDEGVLSSGEDASFTSFDGTRVSARLYRPSPELGYEGPRPLVYYVHGGPQSQERPDFAWFSMPLIQFLTLNGFTVFVPNVRGSTGYGFGYTKQVDKDWGGKDRLDHVHAMTVLAKDEEIDTTRAAVVGRSYGGYMTLTLAARHPELWSAAVDMFGPYDLPTWFERLPETWKPYFYQAIGNPEIEEELAFLVERSPVTYINDIACPLLVIQGQNDPRVIEQESADVVERLRNEGKEVDYLMFPDEGHDVLKYANRVVVYNTITDFFHKHLMTV